MLWIPLVHRDRRDSDARTVVHHPIAGERVEPGTATAVDVLSTV